MGRGVAASLGFLLILSGCIAGESSEAPPPAPTIAETSSETGGIEGNVVTDELQPIRGAQVAIKGFNETLVTAEDGAFAFSRLDPGDYVVLAGAVGYHSKGQRASVKAGEITKAQLIMDRIPIAPPAFNETMKFRTELLINNLCEQSTNPATEGISWKDFTIPINETKPDGMLLAATNMQIDLKSSPNSATIDVDMHLFDPKNTEIAASTSSGPNENIEWSKILPAGKYRLHVCLWAGATADVTIKVEVTYEQGEAAVFAKEKGKK